LLLFPKGENLIWAIEILNGAQVSEIYQFFPKNDPVGRILAVCAGRIISEPKKRVGQAQLVKNFGLSGDCEAGPGGPVYLLSQKDYLAHWENIPDLLDLKYGFLGENLVVTLDLSDLKIGTRLRAGDALMELTQANPPLYRTRVLLAGIITEGDPIIIE
jgi:hypothetical protein